jgi:rare lipoprotein A
MRPKRALRSARPLHVTAGAIMLALPGSAIAVAASPAALPPSALSIERSPAHARFNSKINVTGTGGPRTVGRTLELQLKPAGAAVWRRLAQTTAGVGGQFSFTVSLKSSGELRVVPVSDEVATAQVSAVASPDSPTRTVAVGALLRVPARNRQVVGGQRPDIRGKLEPGVGARRVTLLARHNHRWHVVARTRTGPRGGFDLRPGAAAVDAPLRVSFAGDSRNAAVSAPAGRIMALTPSLASWYSDGGATACGFHAKYGVANRSLPCGTQVTMSYGGRTVTATVDDRGPFAGGRDWDLNQNTAAALGFGGVGTVWTNA